MELTPDLEARIIAFAETRAKNTFHVREAKAHISRDKQGRPQEGVQDWEEEGYLTGYEVCLDLLGFGDIRNTIVVVSSTGRLEIDDSAGGDQGCFACEHGHIREYAVEVPCSVDGCTQLCDRIDDVCVECRRPLCDEHAKPFDIDAEGGGTYVRFVLVADREREL